MWRAHRLTNPPGRAGIGKRHALVPVRIPSTPRPTHHAAMSLARPRLVLRRIPFPSIRRATTAAPPAPAPAPRAPAPSSVAQPRPSIKDQLAQSLARQRTAGEPVQDGLRILIFGKPVRRALPSPAFILPRN